jgi:hypothetical protein
MRDGFWKLVVSGDDVANSFEGWRDDLRASQEVRQCPGHFPDGVPDAVGRPLHLDSPEGVPQLFNLSFDPLEACDLSEAHPDVVLRMMRDLENWFDDVERDRRTIPGRQYRCGAAMRLAT